MTKSVVVGMPCLGVLAVLLLGCRRDEPPPVQPSAPAMKAQASHPQPAPEPARLLGLVPEEAEEGGIEGAASGGVVSGLLGSASGYGRGGGGLALRGAPADGLRREGYDHIEENRFHAVADKPLSTFSIDVDTASFANVRRFIMQGHRLPPADAVRVEELINYFPYEYPDPAGEHPFSITTNVSPAPWNEQRLLVHVGIQGRRLTVQQTPPSNLVFLLDVSGSMMPANKLPLLKAGFRLLVDQLRPQDRVAIVVYAGAAGLVLPSTPGDRKATILDALAGLEAGGSTAGAEGIELAYQVARAHFRNDGNNRVILATDGDFNVGISSDGELVRLIEQQRKSGVFLTVLGVGTGNYQDAKMEKLADKGNGSVHYIDSLLEAQKVLVAQFGATLTTIAKDVKIQVEMNPSRVKAYRLVGYENRKLAAEDFDDDRKDAGELGAGHAVTALYEVVPAGSKEAVPGLPALRYQHKSPTAAAAAAELMTVKFRYKRPDEDQSRLITAAIGERHTPLTQASSDVRFAAAVAEFGLLLRNSPFKGQASYEQVLELATNATGADRGQYRADFAGLVKTARLLAGQRADRGGTPE